MHRSVHLAVLAVLALVVSFHSPRAMGGSLPLAFAGAAQEPDGAQDAAAGAGGAAPQDVQEKPAKGGKDAKGGKEKGDKQDKGGKEAKGGKEKGGGKQAKGGKDGKAAKGGNQNSTGNPVIVWLKETWTESSSPMLDAVAYLLLSGTAFFWGVGILAVGVLFFASGSGWVTFLTILFVAKGLALIVLSATPISPGIYFLGCFVAALWLLAEMFGKKARKVAWTLRGIVLATCLAGVALELPHRKMPSVAVSDGVPVFVLGDSISSGIGFPGETTWDEVLATSHELEVRNFSKRGAKTDSISKRAQDLPAGESIVIIEIGGNDILKGSSAGEYAAALDRLLADVSSDEARRIVMMELPLPPFHTHYGRVQRMLADRYGVELVPKRVLARVMTGRGARVDYVHLSNRGHAALASAVSQVLGL